PGIHELIQELRAVVDEYPDRVLVGETEEMSYYGNGSNELDLVFNFPLMNCSKLTPRTIRANQEERLANLPSGAWPCNTLGNHDTPRMYSRYGNGKNNDALSRLHAALMLTLRGTPFLYNGEEIGMSDWPVADIAQFQDNVSVWLYQSAVNDLAISPADALELANDRGRDKCRAPMQWANTANAGFCPAGVQPWLPVNPDYAQGINVAEQVNDPSSLFHFYRRLLHLRRKTPALIAGDYQLLHQKAKAYLAFLRRTEGQTCLVVLNMLNQVRSLSFDLEVEIVRPLFSSKARRGVRDDPALLIVEPFEIYIGELDEPTSDLNS
ncbi:MAG: alpha-glucosidase C-terminal domain-containing protein, partial [Anaerolineae bacterium]|nr:alpha-glucosidase C-terminal domain-containing protein [Anaerolineae bacterium]